jgi:ABC-type branched-subunit amino acid transport system ATPase component
VALLSLDEVWKSFHRIDAFDRDRSALRGVSLEVRTAEVVTIWGRRGAGRTTLLEVACGIEDVSGGSVVFEGVDVARQAPLGRVRGIAYGTMRFERSAGDLVLDHVAMPALALGSRMIDATAIAYEALRRVQALDCATQDVSRLTPDECVRVTIARALLTKPQLLLLDTPTQGIPPASRRDDLLRLIQSLARHDGIAVLMTVDEASDMAGADQAYTLDEGELRGDRTREIGAVVPLRGARR